MKKDIQIKTVSYVHVGDKLVNTDDLTQEQKIKLAGWINVTFLNEIYKGKAEFFVREDGA